MKTEILLTGATGFVGSHVLEALLPHYSVIILKRATSSLAKIAHLQGYTAYNIEEIGFDKLFSQHRIESIVHTATEYGRAGATPQKIAQVNVNFPLQLLQAGLAHGLKRFINTDSYFTKPSTTYSFLSDYTQSKKTLREELQKENVQVCNLILEHVYGPRDGASKFIEKMIREIALQKVASLELTVGTQQRDFVYVADVAQAFVKVLQNAHTARFQEFAVGTGHSVSVRAAVEEIARLAQSPTVLKFGAIPQRADEIQDSYADLRNLEIPGWRADTTLSQGLQKTLDYYRNHSSTA